MVDLATLFHVCMCDRFAVGQTRQALLSIRNMPCHAFHQDQICVCWGVSLLRMASSFLKQICHTMPADTALSGFAVCASASKSYCFFDKQSSSDASVNSIQGTMLKQ